ncbi:MAG: hypothetical protein IPM42_06760 [Saprospiraceae bacterium]|nr:hypothetical protein [Saprospiraceae bacterium]
MQEDNNQPLPPELGWNNMKDGIFEKVQIMENEISSHENNKSSRRKRIVMFFFILFALSFGMFFISQRMIKTKDYVGFDTARIAETKGNKSTPTDINSSMTKNQINNQSELHLEKDRKSNVTYVPKIAKESEPNQELIKSNYNAKNSHQKVETTKSNSNDSFFSSKETKSIYPTPILQKINEAEPSNEPNQISGTKLLANSFTKEINKSSQNSFADSLTSSLSEGNSLLNLISPYLTIHTLPSLGFDQINSEKLNQLTIEFENVDSLFRIKSFKSKTRNQLILEGGLTFWDEGDNNTIPSRAQYESPITSYQLQGYYLRSFKSSYFIMAGLQYQQLESKLVFDNTIQDYKIILKDTIKQVHNNSLTGEKRVIYGDVEHSVEAHHRIRHYNKTKLFKISMALGKTWKFSSFQADIYLGGALNTIVHNQGRMFYNDSIIDYNGSSNILFNNQMTADGIFGARLHYFVNKNIGLTTGFQTQKSLMNWSNQENINFYPVSYGLQLGLSYSLK